MNEKGDLDISCFCWMLYDFYSVFKSSFSFFFCPQDSLHWVENCCWTFNNEALMPCFCKKTMSQQHFLYKQIGTNCCIAKFQTRVYCEHYEQLALLLMIKFLVLHWSHSRLYKNVSLLFLEIIWNLAYQKQVMETSKLLCYIGNWWKKSSCILT